MSTIKRTTSDNADFQSLVRLLDADLKIWDGDEHAFFAQLNKIEGLKNIIVCYQGDTPVGCGAFKKFDSKTLEIKGMFVQPNFRGKGFAMRILNELELWAKEINCWELILETGKKQPEAIGLYQKAGFSIIPTDN